MATTELTDGTKVQLIQIEPYSYQHTADDTRAPRRFRVKLDGVLIGEVSSWSRPSHRPGQGRILGARNGCSRTWHADRIDADGRWYEVDHYASSRRFALDVLVDAHRAASTQFREDR